MNFLPVATQFWNCVEISVNVKLHTENHDFKFMKRMSDSGCDFNMHDWGN